MNIIELWKTACDDGNTSQYNLEKFAELVAEHEREECIRECYEVAKFQGDAHDCAAAIRARSKA